MPLNANTTLPPCPDKPNCVSSQAVDERHAIAPLNTFGDRARAYQVLLNLVQQQARSQVMEKTERHIKASFTSMVFRFTDDVLFVFENDETIQIRSASRVGYSDFGVNRKRMERIRQQFNEAMK